MRMWPYPCGHTYFARPVEDHRFVKIGCTSMINVRIDYLRGEFGQPYELLAKVFDTEYEERFHAYFEDWYAGREHFMWSDLMAETIEAINEGAFDPSILPPCKRLAATRHRGTHHGKYVDDDHRAVIAALSRQRRTAQGRAA